MYMSGEAWAPKGGLTYSEIERRRAVRSNQIPNRGRGLHDRGLKGPRGEPLGALHTTRSKERGSKKQRHLKERLRAP